MLESHYYKDMVEAGCDEAGRGCLAGSVYAAAVILPPGYQNAELNDSKKLTDKKRKALREQIERAKTYRDDYMDALAEEYPQYDWKGNKGYPTKKHRAAIREFGVTPYHRMSYNLLGTGELSIDFKD